MAPAPNVFNNYNNNNNSRQKTDDDNNDIIKINHYAFTRKIKLSGVVTALLISMLLISTLVISIPIPTPTYGQTPQSNKLRVTTQVVCPTDYQNCPKASQFTLTIRDTRTPNNPPVDLRTFPGNTSGVDVNLGDLGAQTPYYYVWVRNYQVRNDLALYHGYSPHCQGTISGGQSLTCTVLLVYTTPVDSDSDRIPDSWETDGIPYNGTDGTLQHYMIKDGNPHRKHLYVEVDYMEHHFPIGGNGDFGWLAQVRKSFKFADVSYPNATKGGVNLFTDLDEQIPHQNTTSMEDLIFRIRPEWFGTAVERADSNHDAMLAAKAMVYHYSLFAHQQPGTTSSGLAQTPGTNSYVTLGGPGWPTDPSGHNVGSIDQQKGTFMHELGHNLNLGHSGPPAERQINCKPNYFSVMNYLFQFSNFVSDRPLDYSRSALNTLDKTNLDENVGMTQSDPPNLRTVYGPIQPREPLVFAEANGSAVDWNKNGIKTDRNVNANINSIASCGSGGGGNSLDGYYDWGNLIFTTSNIYWPSQQQGSQQQQPASGNPLQNTASGNPLESIEKERELTSGDVIASRLALLHGVNDAVAQVKSGQVSGQALFQVQNLIGVLKKQEYSAQSPTAGAAAASATGTTTTTTTPGLNGMPSSSSLPPEVVALTQKPTGGISVDMNHVAKLLQTDNTNAGLETAIGELDKLLAEVITLASSQSQPPPQQQQQLQPPPSSLSSPSTLSQTPMANAGVSQTVEANATVMLDGRNSQPTKPGTTITAYQWTQLPTQGAVPVNLIGGPNVPTPMFIAPTLPYDTTLSFGLKVMASDGSVSTNDAVVYVMVKRYAVPMTGAGGGGGAPSLGAFQPQQPLQQQQPALPPQQQLPGMGQQQQQQPNLQIFKPPPS